MQRHHQYEERPSVQELVIDPASDAKVLREAMDGLGTDEDAIINILANRTNNQRQRISSAYKAGFSRDLIDDLKSDLSGNFEDTIIAMMTPRDEYLALKLKQAMTLFGTREKILIDILCTATNQEIVEINEAYHKMFHFLESDVTGATCGPFKKLLISLIAAGRNEDDSSVDPIMATKDAQDLYGAGVKRRGADESVFNTILATRSYPQIRLILEEYQKLTGYSLEHAIGKEFSGNIKAGLLAIVKCARNRATYFAERLHESIIGLGTRDDDLIFIVVTRSEIDMENIKEEYLKLYDTPLGKDICGDTSGDYRKVLLSLIGEWNATK